MRNEAIIMLRLLRVKLEREIYIKRSTTRSKKLCSAWEFVETFYFSIYIDSSFSENIFDENFFLGVFMSFVIVIIKVTWLKL